MSRFGRKLILWLVISVLILGGVSLTVTTTGLERYYLATQKVALQKVYETINALPIESINQKAYALGKDHGVLLFTLSWQQDEDKLNDSLKKAFTEQGILVQKLWLWEEDAKKLEAGEVVNQLYDQGEGGYSLLIKYRLKGDTLLVMSRTISHIDGILSVINLFIMIVWFAALGGIVLCIILYVRRMTRPLLEMERLVEAISQLKFQHIEVDTGDELESLAKGINQMSDSLQLSHRQLEEKNEQMKQLLANVSHELKTPIALIKAYGIAIQEDMDDGTFLQTILEQNEVMEQMVSKLLLLAKKEQQVANYKWVQLVDIIEGYLKDYDVYRNEVEVNTAFEVIEAVWADEEAIRCAIGNFISNAFKYTVDGKVHIRCFTKEDKVRIEVRNGISQKGKEGIKQMWQPFYVGEDSRNKALCGTGLGLYMTKQLLEKAGIKYGCFVIGDTIVFYMECKKS